MNMRRAYVLAAHAVRARLADQRPDLLTRLDALTGRDIAVVRGVHDSVQEVLACLEVPCRVAAGFAPKKAAIVFGNCGWRAKNEADVTAWVEAGGWLVTSDWALDVVQRCFPDTIGRGAGQTGDEVIGIEPAADSAFSDVVVLGCDPQWWLEAASYPVAVYAPDRVTVEAASHELLQRFGAPAVATRFDWGAGHVFHVISHFWLKKTRQADARHQGSAADFLRVGMRLDDDRVAQVFDAVGFGPDVIDFAAAQSAVTSTELIVRLCVDAVASRPAETREAQTEAPIWPAPKRNFWSRIFRG